MAGCIQESCNGTVLRVGIFRHCLKCSRRWAEKDLRDIIRVQEELDQVIQDHRYEFSH